MPIRTIREQLTKLGNKEKAAILQRFFKTGPGEYGEGDIFMGVRVPEVRKLAKKFHNIAAHDIDELLRSAIHEVRLLALLILVGKFAKEDGLTRKNIYDKYMENLKYVNNWDLVDASAKHIVGAFLKNKSRKPLYRLAKSTSVWERRIAIMATFHFINHNEFAETLKIAEMLLNDKEDLIHKAVGWMLREVGNRHHETEEEFLRKHYTMMPRTMLRYAIEKFPEAKRQLYLKGKI